MREGRKVKRVYGQQREEYDPFLGGLFKSKAKKKKEKQEHSQRDANISLTHYQGAKTAAEAEAARFNAQAAKAKAAAAERLAAMSNVQLQGAQATVQLKNAGLMVSALLIVGVIGAAIYIVRENKKAAQLEATKLKLQGTAQPSFNQ